VKRITLIVVTTLFVGTLLAQAPQTPAAAPSLAAEAKAAYNNIKNNMTKMAEKMPEENYAFQPVKEIRTFGALVGHVADSQARACSAVLGGEPKLVNAASKTAKADLVAALKESFTICDSAYDALTDANAAEGVKAGRNVRTRLSVLNGMASHSNEEYGYMAVYLRLKGVVPPSSEGR
jgi:hypothetical protein